jgi:plasmid stabilization system protein ParE
MVEVRWTDSALEDLYRIGDHIAEDSPRYALEYTLKLRSSTDVLERYPGMVRVIPELEDPKLREIRVGNYRILLLAEKNRMWVLAVYHAKRKLPVHLIRSRQRRMK